MALDPNSKYLRQNTTGEIYGYCEEFAKRSDMVPYRPGQDVSDVEVLTIDMRKPAAPEGVTVTPDGFRGGALMGAILGEG
jgi:hypothetical protein